MKIYIDEAGIFADPKQTKKHNVSLIGALIIPDQSYLNIVQEVEKIKKAWNYEGEIKGSKLSESQVAELVIMLQGYNVLFITMGIDSSFLAPDIVANHKEQFTQHVLNNISEYHAPTVVDQITKMSEVKKIDNQLYAQYMLMTDLINRAHQYSTLYYAQILPKELKNFEWIIDAKNKIITPVEAWWYSILKPSLQTMPFHILEGADYSYYSAEFDSECGNSNINKIMKNLAFNDSATDIGLQLVDVLTTSLKKAMNNKFQLHGWQKIGTLMKIFREDSFIPLFGFDDAPAFIVRVPYAHVIKELQRNAQQIVFNI